jgi:uncharacterized membrane protein YeaQ/YmgE (transglycosylase-associated protein family)
VTGEISQNLDAPFTNFNEARSMTSLIGAIIIGFLAGLVAGWLAPGRRPAGCLVTIAIGIAGAVFATYAGRALGLYSEGQTAGFIGSVIGAVLLLALWRGLGPRS